MSTVELGRVLAPLTVRFTRADLVRYAGASTDFNPIHWSDRKAAELGLPSVIAHGMLTMGTALRVVTDWIGDPGRIRPARPSGVLCLPCARRVGRGTAHRPGPELH